MGEYKFGLTGAERKALVKAMSEILNAPAQYHGTPNFDYTVGDYHIDKEGTVTVTGKIIFGLLTALAERGFMPEQVSETPENPAEPEADTISIEMPLTGFTPETIDNLCKMVLAKETLIKKALGAENLPIQVLEDRIRFPWFTAEHSENIAAYTQFITQLCKTAKTKKRVTAKPQETFENEKFAMRVWLIGLGFIGDDYKTARRLLLQNLGGNGAWRYGAPDRATAAQTAENAPSEAAVAPDKAGATAADSDAKGAA